MNIISRTLEFNSKNLNNLMHILGSYGPEARLVGGCVRDSLLGLGSSDIDIATPLRPEEVISLLFKNGIRAIPTGLNFGTVTALIDEEVFEITSLRKDIKCDGRHAVIEFTEDFEVDAARRDFTINALSYSMIENKIYDYFGGIEDMQAKKVIFIGDPTERIKEDFLRILRFFRFSARYSDDIDQEGLKACLENKEKLELLPRERINIEMDKMLGAKNADKVLKVMISGAVKVLDDLILNPNVKSSSNSDLSSLYAMLLCKNSVEDLNKTLPQLRFSKKRKKEIVQLVSFMQNPPKAEDFIEIWVDGEDAPQYLNFALNMGLITETEAQNLKIINLRKRRPLCP